MTETQKRYAQIELQRMQISIQRYDLKLVYVPKKEMHISDALSRSYLEETPEILVDDEINIDSIETQLPVSPTKLQQIKEATADETQHTLKILYWLDGQLNDLVFH